MIAAGAFVVLEQILVVLRLKFRFKRYVLQFSVSTILQREGSFLSDFVPQSLLWCNVLYTWA